MPSSRLASRERMRIHRGYYERHGVQPSSTDLFEALPQYRRKEILAEIALHRIEQPVSAGHRIAAIKEMNLIDHIYDERPQTQVNVLFVIGKGESNVDG